MNKLNNIIESKEYKDWIIQVKLHDAYNKHVFKNGQCPCGKIDFFENYFMNIKSPKSLDKLLYNVIYQINSELEKIIFLSTAIEMLYNHEVYHDVLIDLANEFIKYHDDEVYESKWIDKFPSELLSGILKNNKFTIPSFNAFVKSSNFKYYILNLNNIMLLKWPEKTGIKDIHPANIYKFAMKVKEGAKYIKHYPSKGILKPLQLLIKRKAYIQSTLNSSHYFLGVKFWLAWNFHDWYEEIKDEVNISCDIDILLWFYKYNKDYDTYLKSTRNPEFEAEEANAIVQRDIKKIHKGINKLQGITKMAILMNLTLEEFYEVSDDDNYDYLKYTVDEYNNLVKQDKVTFPEITPDISNRIERTKKYREELEELPTDFKEEI